MKKKQCLYYHALSTILIANCDKFFVFFFHLPQYFHMNKPKIHGEQLQCRLVHPFCTGNSGGRGLIQKCDWCCDYSNTLLLLVVLLAHASFSNV